MSISYSGIVGYGKVTLPSVEGWSKSTNIIKDPPKSITTRKIDKVGDTMSIQTQLSESGDRFYENINYYARGVDPMISVSYQNTGSNGGLNPGVDGLNGASSQKGRAFLPYRVARDGAFRPPIQPPETLLPLSRLPRLVTSATTNVVNPDFTRRIRDCGTDQNTRQVKPSTLVVSCSAPVGFIEKNTVAPELVTKSIRPILETFVNLNKSANDGGARARQHVIDVAEPIELSRNRPIGEATTNPSDSRRDVNARHDVIERTSRIRPVGEATTNKSGIIERRDLNATYSPVVNIKQSSVKATNVWAAKSGVTRDLIGVKRDIEHKRPRYIGHETNKAAVWGPPAAEWGAKTVVDRSASLRAKIQPGGYEGHAAVPRVTTSVPHKTLTKVR